MKVAVVPQYIEALGDGELFEFEEYNPTAAYGADRIGFYALRSTFESAGDEVFTVDQVDPTEMDAVVFIDMNFALLDTLLNVDDRPRLVYVMREPPSVRWYNTSAELIRFAQAFDSVLTWNVSLAKAVDRFDPYAIPQYLATNETEVPPFESRDLLVNVSSRKYSNHPEELYSERERVLQYFDENYPDSFSLYGLYWNRRHRPEDVYHHTKLRSYEYRTYRGLAESKSSVYREYRFALCFENMTGIDGYLTEKLFDCLRAGAVPVYWGADDIGERIPDSAYVDYREFGTPDALAAHLASIDEAEFQEYLEAGRKILEEEGQVAPSRYAETVKAATRGGSEDRSVSASLREEIRLRGDVERAAGATISDGRSEAAALLSVLRRRPRYLLENPSSLVCGVRSLLP